MSEVANILCKSVYEEAVFYNYFLRPATKRANGEKGFKKDCEPLDRIVAGTALCGIIDIVIPDIVIFVSKYAFDEFMEYKKSVGYNTNATIDYVCHPASFGPNGWSKSENGKQKFEKLLKEYWVK